MTLIAQVKLIPIDARADVLRRTREATNAAYDAVSELAWDKRTFKKFDLQKRRHLNIRETYGLLMQLAIRVIAKLDTTTSLIEIPWAHSATRQHCLS
jgi:putative transposase